MGKVKIDSKQAKRDIEKFKRIAKPLLKTELQKEITGSIERGVSPVKGFRRFVEYSASYKDQIASGRYGGKRRRPVNLKLTGALLKSLFIKISKKGLIVGFDNKLADIHNRLGAGKSKTVRRMLPSNNGEEFNRSITTRLKEVLNGVAKNIFKQK